MPQLSSNLVLLPGTTAKSLNWPLPTRGFLVLLLLLLPVLSAHGQQDPNDQGDPDSVYLVIDKTIIGPEDSGAVVDLYVRNDVQSLIGVIVPMYWTNPKVRLDSVVNAPISPQPFDLYYPFRDGQLDSTNLYQQFLFVGISVNPPGLPPGDSPKLLATYYFSADQWGASDTCCIDTGSWDSPNTDFLFADESGREYLPAWGGEICARAGGYQTECWGTTGNVMLVPECDSTDQTVDIVDLQMMIEHQFLSLRELCWWQEADMDYSGEIDITDLQMMIDCQYITLEPYPECP